MADAMADYAKKLLVVVEDTPESDRAVTFAAYRVKRTGGTVVLLAVIEPPGFLGLGVEDVLRAEALEAAEALIDIRMARLARIGNVRCETVIREGRGPDAVISVVREDKNIAILVLGASTSTEGPGPLVSYFANAVTLPIPVTIVPGSMTDEEIIAIC